MVRERTKNRKAKGEIESDLPMAAGAEGLNFWWSRRKELYVVESVVGSVD